MKRALIQCLAAVLVCAGLTSCRSARMMASAESARLRREVVELRKHIDSLEQRNRDLEIQVQQATSSAGPAAAEILANIPHVVEITIDRRSFAKDRDGDGRPEVLIIFVAPTDGRGRFEKMVGTVTATAALVPRRGDPLVVGRAEYTTSQVNDAYRYSFTGLHYTFEVPLQWPEAGTDGSGETDVVARVFYTDGRSGAEFTAERVIPLSP